MGSRPDLLLVVGTSLKIPGVKTLVREMSKVIRPPGTFVEPKSEEVDIEEGDSDEYDYPIASGSTATSTQSTSSGSPKKKSNRPTKIKTIYLNFDFPTPSREWQGIFDAWALGDVQEFVEILSREKILEEGRMEKKRVEKVRMLERKLEREAKKAAVLRGNDGDSVTETENKSTRKRKLSEKGAACGKKVVGGGVAMPETRLGKTKSIAGAGMVRRRSRSSTLSIEEDSVVTKVNRSSLAMFSVVDKPNLRRGRSKS